MPSVTITLTDTPTGGISVHTDFKPAAGKPCSAAQAAGLDIINRTRKDYGLPPSPVEALRTDAGIPTRSVEFGIGGLKFPELPV